jgi:hypothetical protein
VTRQDVGGLRRTPLRVTRPVLRVDDDASLVGVLQVGEGLRDHPVPPVALALGRRPRLTDDEQLGVDRRHRVRHRVGHRLVAADETVERAVRLDVHDPHPLRVGQGAQRAELVEHGLRRLRG